VAAQIIDGKAVAAEVRAGVAREVEAFRSETGQTPGLATVLVGDDPASHVYVGNKIRACEEVGIRSIHHHLGEGTPQDELIDLVRELGEDDSVDGILVQMPVPEHHRPRRGWSPRSPRRRTSTASPQRTRACWPRGGQGSCPVRRRA